MSTDWQYIGIKDLHSCSSIQSTTLGVMENHSNYPMSEPPTGFTWVTTLNPEQPVANPYRSRKNERQEASNRLSTQKAGMVKQHRPLAAGMPPSSLQGCIYGGSGLVRHVSNQANGAICAEFAYSITDITNITNIAKG